MKESDLKSWEAPGLVHASAEDMHTFFTDLAGDTSLLYLQQRCLTASENKIIRNFVRVQSANASRDVGREGDLFVSVQKRHCSV